MSEKTFRRDSRRATALFKRLTLPDWPRCLTVEGTKCSSEYLRAEAHCPLPIGRPETEEDYLANIRPSNHTANDGNLGDGAHRERRVGVNPQTAAGCRQIGQFEQTLYVVHNAHVLAGTRIPTRAVWTLNVAAYDRP
jgi:hypothetical protein